jgi:ketosteroid isomerase-like protein
METSTEPAAVVVRRFWALMDAADFAGAGALLADGYVCDWPQSHERICGRANFVAVNEHYPGRWRIAVRRLIAAGEEATSEVLMTNEEGKTAHAVSFFVVRDGRIERETDYWPEPYAAPAWRLRWVEALDEVDA